MVPAVWLSATARAKVAAIVAQSCWSLGRGGIAERVPAARHGRGELLGRHQTRYVCRAQCEGSLMLMDGVCGVCPPSGWRGGRRQWVLRGPRGGLQAHALTLPGRAPGGRIADLGNLILTSPVRGDRAHERLRRDLMAQRLSHAAPNVAGQALWHEPGAMPAGDRCCRQLPTDRRAERREWPAGVLRDDGHDLTKRLAHLGVRYMTAGKGRSARSYLLKQ